MPVLACDPHFPVDGRCPRSGVDVRAAANTIANGFGVRVRRHVARRTLTGVGADLHLDPDAVARLAATVRRIADGLPTRPPVPPHGTAGDGPERSVRAAVAELVAFADAAGAAVCRVRHADDVAARALRAVDEPAASGFRPAEGPTAHALARSDEVPASGPIGSSRMAWTER